MEDKSSEAEMAPGKKGKIGRLLVATVGAVAIAATVAANLTDIIELWEKVGGWSFLEDKNEIALENIYSTTLSSDFNKYIYNIYPRDDHQYSLYVQATIKYKNNEFNNSNYLLGLSEFSHNYSNEQSMEVDAHMEEVHLFSTGESLKTQIKNMKNIKYGIYIKFKARPDPNSYFLFTTGNKEWKVKYNEIEWEPISTESGDEKVSWYGGYASVHLLADDPDWVVLHSAKIREVYGDSESSSAASLLEVVLENRSSTPLALSDLNIFANHKKGFTCYAPGKPADWEEISLNWEKIVTSKGTNDTNTGWTTINGEKIVINSTFRLPTCVNDYQFKVSIPVIQTIEPNEMKRVVFKVYEYPPAFMQKVGNSGFGNPPPRTLRDWDRVTLTIEPNQNIYPKTVVAY